MKKKKISCLKEETPISRQLRSLSEDRGENSVVHHTFLQIPGKKNALSVTGESIDKTAGVRCLSYSRLAWKMLISPVSVSGSSCNFSPSHPCSMTPSAFSHFTVHTQREICILTCPLQQGTSLLYLKTTSLLLRATLETGGDLKSRKNSHTH